jgi:hypothetical protein
MRDNLSGETKTTQKVRSVVVSISVSSKSTDARQWAIVGPKISLVVTSEKLCDQLQAITAFSVQLFTFSVCHFLLSFAVNLLYQV